MIKKYDIEKMHQVIKASSYMDYHSFLNDVYQHLKSELGKVSWVDFTESCGLGKNNTLYQIVKKNRPLSSNIAKKIATSLGLKNDERKYFLQLSIYQHAKNSSDRAQAMEKLFDLKSKCLSANWDRKNLNIFSEWYHLTILELLRLDHAIDDPTWIASVLNPRVPISKVEASLELLQDLGWIAFDEEKKRLYPTRDRFSTGREIQGMAIQKYHQSMIQLASQSLSQEKPGKRDITSVTVSVPRDAIKDLKDLTAEFRQKIMAYADRCLDANDIIQVNIQLFPLTKINDVHDPKKGSEE